MACRDTHPHLHLPRPTPSPSDPAQVFGADGACWQPGPGRRHPLHRARVRFVRDVVNYSPTEEILWAAREADYSGWFYHHARGRDGEVSVYARHVLAFRRRGAAEARQPREVDLAKQAEGLEWSGREMDLEQKVKQYCAEGDARGAARARAARPG